MISEQAFIKAAELLKVDVAAIKAVAEVESRGNGFLETGEPLILFEPHIFWKQLTKAKLNPKFYAKANSDILYEKWGEKPYGRFNQQHGKLQKAIKIHRDSALASASWGRFQIMGFNYELAGFDTLQEFINAMYKDEDEHLFAFVNFVINKKLNKYLQNHNWEKFAEGYNGKSYKLHKYDKRLEEAYNKYK